MSLFLLTSPFLPIVFLIGSLLLTICNTAFVHLGRFKSKELFKTSQPTFLFFYSILQYLFPKQEWENLYFTVSLSKHIYQLAYATFAFFFVFSTFPHLRESIIETPSSDDWVPLLLISGSIIAISVILDFFVRILASIWSRVLLNLAAPLSFVYLIIFFPVIGLLLYLTKNLTRKLPKEEEDLMDKAKLRELIRESELRHHLDLGDQKLISSFIHFKERVAKEIMVPRVDLFSLSSDTTIREASKLFSQEGYSRIPIYTDNLDHIVGVVLYKDLLKCFASANANLDATLETIAKPVLYSPENKKASQLLQEFRNKQIHMAIVVDEYGGTEGIVTIEDILEELVGEIEDEYDIGEENSFWEVPGGGWVIDSKMTLLDIADQIGIHIPTHPEYETLGGYVYHCAGTIPSKGWRLSHDEFELEVISSNERAIKRIKIVPRIQPE